MQQRLFRFVSGLAFAAAVAVAQPGFISTVVGDVPNADGGPAVRAYLSGPRLLGYTPSLLFGPNFLGFDKSGNLTFLDGDYRIRRVNPEGTINTVAGDGTSPEWTGKRSVVAERSPASSIDATAMLQAPDGTVYFSHMDLACPATATSPAQNRNHLLSVSPAGELKQVAGGNCGNFVDRPGPVSQAAIAPIGAIAVDAAGRFYLAEPSRNRILKVDEGTISVFAGTGAGGFSGDGGSADRATLRNPGDLVVLPDGTAAIADRGNNRVRVVRPDGTISTLVEQAGVRELALSASGELFVGNGRTISKVAANGSLTEVLAAPHGDFTVDPEGRIVISSLQIFRYNPGGDRTLLAGAALETAPTRSGVFTRVLFPFRVGTSPAGDVWFSDNFGLRRLRPDGVVDPPLAGAPTAANFSLDSDGAVYYTTVRGIEKLTAEGQSSITVTRAELADRQPYALLAAGNRIYFSELAKNQVFAADQEGKVTLFAGNGQAGDGGDDGPAIQASLRGPITLSADAAGAIYIGSAGGLRKIDSAGKITTLARPTAPCRSFILERGTSVSDACLFTQTAIADREGNVYGTGFYSLGFGYGGARAEVYRISAATRKIEPLASGLTDEQGDGGPAREAGHVVPRGVALDAAGNLYVASGHRIRKIAGSGPFVSSPEAIVFTAALRGAPVTDAIRVSTSDTEPRGYRASVTYNGRAGGWLAVTPPAGNVTGDLPATLRLTANPAGLAKGFYLARVALEDPATGRKIEVPVTLLVSGTEQQLRLSQTGLTFQAVAGGPGVAEQRVAVLNAGRGILNWTATQSTLTGGNWLSIAPAAGRSTGGEAAPEIAVRANPQGLAPGLYYGLVSVSSPDADNAPQSTVVLLSILGPAERPGSVVYPAGTIFSGAPGSSLAAQNVDLGNPNPVAGAYTVTAVFPTSLRWLTVTPATGTINSGQIARLTLRASTEGAAAGVYRATVSVRFTPENVTRTIDAVMILTAGGRAAKDQRGADGCTSKSVIPVFRAPGGGFAVTAGWPQPVEMQVIDDCLDPVMRGRITVSFSSGDQPVPLTHIGDGRWSGTWSPQAQRTSGLRLSANVEAFDLGLNGATAIEGGVRNNPDQPVIEASGILNGASFVKGAPVAVGSAVTVRGSRLSTATQRAPALPLPTRLGDTVVQVGGGSLPLRVATDGRVDAVLPYGIADSTVHQAFVRRGNTYSLPEPVIVSAVQPAIYAVAGTGKGQGDVRVVTEAGLVLADSARPAKAGEEVLIRATGLGHVDQPVRDGVAAPGGTKVIAAVTVFIQGKEAEVKSAGLAEGEAGVYVVRAVVPPVTQDSSAAVVLMAGDQAVSPVVTIATTDQ